LERLGIDAERLPNPSEIIPQALALHDAIEANDVRGAVEALQALGKSVDPAAFEGMFQKIGDALAERLPDGVAQQVGDYLRGLGEKLGGAEGAQFLQTLLNSDALPDLVGAIADGKPMDALRAA